MLEGGGRGRWIEFGLYPGSRIPFESSGGGSSTAGVASDFTYCERHATQNLWPQRVVTSAVESASVRSRHIAHSLRDAASSAIDSVRVDEVDEGEVENVGVAHACGPSGATFAAGMHSINKFQRRVPRPQGL